MGTMKIASGILISGVYRIRHEISGESYIGQSKDIHARLRYHQYALKHGRHTCRALQALWDQGGRFMFELLEIVERLDGSSGSSALLKRREKHWQAQEPCLLRDERRGRPPTVTSATIQKIQRLRAGGRTTVEIAEKLGLAQNTVSRVSRKPLR